MTASSSDGGGEPSDALLTRLYPHVDESITPLPRSWNPADKDNALGMSHNNLRLHYKGPGKNHKDAAAVRATHPIPAMCGLYYYEVKIISKGRDGYMGIGLCKRDVMLCRLPGWELGSYGYHGDDGNFFCSSGTGAPYGPTFTTGDVIGCGYNMIDHTIFYTKNGHNLGVAARNVVGELYPTIGLQTPGESIETNFGQSPFMYAIDEELLEARTQVRRSIEQHNLPLCKVDWFNKLVASYLTHQGYCKTAEAFATVTQQVSCQETLAASRIRQQIRRLVLSGRITETINTVNANYPTLLENNHALMFLLKCRQFIEMVAGVDHETKPSTVAPARKRGSRSPAVHMSSNGAIANGTTANGVSAMECDGELNGTANGAETFPEDLRTRRTRNTAHTEKLINYGKELSTMAKTLTPPNNQHVLRLRKRMEDAFSLLAYSDPWQSPLAHLLLPAEREPVANALNRAILQDRGLPCRAPLEQVYAHVERLREAQASNNMGAAAFIDQRW